MSDYAVSFRVYLDSKDAEKKIKGLEKDFSRLAKSGGFTHIETDFRKIEKSIDSAAKSTRQLDKAFSSLGAVISAVAITSLTSQFVNLTDSFKSLQAQLSIATKELTDFDTAFASVSTIANESGQSLEAVAALYGKIARSAKELGLTEKEVAQITRLTAQALAVSGTSASEASAAILQFSQALGAGVLRGDEFNSLMENAPRLMKALADGLGLPVGKLRSLAEQGLLTADIVSTALQSQAAVIEGEFNQMPETASRALQKLRNEFLIQIGQLDATTGLSDSFVELVNILTENLAPALRTVIILLGTLAGVAVGRVVGALASVATSALAARNALLAMSAVNPYTFLAAAAGTAVAAIISFNAELDTTSAKIKALENATMNIDTVGIEAAKKALEELRKERDALLEKVKDKPTTLIDAFKEGKVGIDALKGHNYAQQIEEANAAIKQAEEQIKAYAQAQQEAANSTEALAARQKLAMQQFEALAAKYATKAEKMRAEIEALNEAADAAGISRNSKQYLRVLEAIKKKYETADTVDKAIRLRAQLEIQQQKLLATAQLNSLRLQEEQLKASYQRREISAAQFFQKRIALIRQETSTQRAVIQAQIQAKQAEVSTATNEEQRLAMKREMIQLQEQLTQLQGKEALEIARVRSEREQLIKDLSQQVNQYAANFNLIQVDGEKKKLEQLRVQLLALGQTEKADTVAQLIDMQSAKDRFAELESEFNALVDRLNAKRAQLDIQVQTGQLTGPEAALQLSEQAAALYPQLEQLKEEMRAVGEEFLPPDQLQQRMNQFQITAEQVKASALSLGQVLSTQFGDRFTNELTQVINGTKSLGDAFRSMATMVLQEIQRIIVKMLVMKSIQAAMGGVPLPLPGFATGGYTGDGGKYEPAGVVHRGEFVFTKEAVKRLGVGFLYGLQNAAVGRTTVNKTINNISYASGGYVNPAPAPAQSVNIVNVLDPNEITGAMDTPEGENAILNVISRNAEQIKSALL